LKHLALSGPVLRIGGEFLEPPLTVGAGIDVMDCTEEQIGILVPFQQNDRVRRPRWFQPDKKSFLGI
jgi:hypothetical protein